MIPQIHERPEKIREPHSEKPKQTFPPDHVAGMRVPKGGSSCSSCEYLAEDKKRCKNEYFIKWLGSNIIPAPIDEYCSDYYEPSQEARKEMEHGKQSLDAKRV